MTQERVLIVEDEENERTGLAELVSGWGYRTDTAADGVEALEKIPSFAPAIVITDVKMPRMGGMELVEKLADMTQPIAVVMVTAQKATDTAFHAGRLGVQDYIEKPIDFRRLRSILTNIGEIVNTRNENESLRRRLRDKGALGTLVGASAEMQEIFRLVELVAPSTASILITGASGTGKELVARTIHAYGPNAQKPFLPVDCGSLVPTLIESELFGYVKGAFTGANRSKDGLLVSAEGGTVFLDEIGELTVDLQAKLLRALQEREVRPVGATHRVPIRARIVAATNRDLAEMVEKGTFRKDLFYRLNVVNLRLPSLRDRREDIPLLAAHFLDRISREHGIKFTLSDEALRIMMRHDWPGNVRELEHAVERGCALSSGPVLHLGDLPTQLQKQGLEAQRANAPMGETAAGGPAPAVQTLADLEREAILGAIRTLNGDKLQAAKLLGIGKTTLYRKLKEYGIADPMRDE